MDWGRRRQLIARYQARSEQRRPAPRRLPVDQDRAARVVGAEVVELPVAVHERLRRGGQRLDQRTRSGASGVTTAAAAGATSASSGQPFATRRGTRCGEPAAASSPPPSTARAPGSGASPGPRSNSSPQAQKAACRAAMCRRNRACWASGIGASVAGTSHRLTSRISRAQPRRSGGGGHDRLVQAAGAGGPGCRVPTSTSVAPRRPAQARIVQVSGQVRCFTT